MTCKNETHFLLVHHRFHGSDHQVNERETETRRDENEIVNVRKEGKGKDYTTTRRRRCHTI